jgi:hypothetical protein
MMDIPHSCPDIDAAIKKLKILKPQSTVEELIIEDIISDLERIRNINFQLRKKADKIDEVSSRYRDEPMYETLIQYLNK